MNISSNLLFHLTYKIDTLKSILSDKFYGSFCIETLHFDNKEDKLYVPMISFCDIPLTILSNKTKYGEFGLGMTKEWGIKNQLNPVLYLEKNSSLSDSIVQSFIGAHKLLDILEPEFERINSALDKMTEDQNNNSLDIIKFTELNNERIRQGQIYNTIAHIRYSLCFTKHYSDDLVRNNITTPNYKFYDEREWRYLPKLGSPIFNTIRSADDYNNWRGQTENKPIISDVSLSFNYQDIEFIIVEKSSDEIEIKEFIKNLSNFNQNERETLYSKITSFERIRNM
jgi:hypothetical protein